MAVSSERSMFTPDSRRAVRLLRPGIQLRLPAYLLGITVAFAMLIGWHSHVAFGDIYEMAAREAPPGAAALIQEQARDFVLFTAVILAGYVLAVGVFCVAYTHRLIGPTVALRRQVQALKNGNYRQRVHLRRGDGTFEGLASDLNELTQILSYGRGGEGGS